MISQAIGNPKTGFIAMVTVKDDLGGISYDLGNTQIITKNQGIEMVKFIMVIRWVVIDN